MVDALDHEDLASAAASAIAIAPRRAPNNR
jgi:hypothetical protein